MAQTTNIPNTLLPAGPNPVTFPASNQVYNTAVITIFRDVTGGLNDQVTTMTLDLAFDYSEDSGQTWRNISAETLHGGTYVNKNGVTDTRNSLGIGADHPFPVGTVFRVTTNASSAVEIAGTVVYS